MLITASTKRELKLYLEDGSRMVFESPEFFWLDIIMVNQNSNSQDLQADLSNIPTIYCNSECYIVYNYDVALQRAWCLYEAGHRINKGTAKQQARKASYLKKIKSWEDVQCSFPEDKKMILEAINVWSAL